METGKETILRLYAAYRRQDIDEVVAGMHEQARFQAVPTTRVYAGRDDIRLFFEREIHDLDEFDFRVESVEERAQVVLLMGRFRLFEDGRTTDHPIGWLSTMKDRLILEFQPFMDPQEAVEKFRDAAFA
jgi:ketosteroid isomerase-like protein